MDAQLMREFEDFEGLGEQVSEDLHIDDNELEDDPTFRPVNAATLSSADIFYEMEKRGIKTTGFPDTDRERLQAAFDDEFKKDMENEKIRRREVKRRAAQQEGLMKRRLLMERTLQEEQDELAKNHQTNKMIDFLKANQVGKSLRMDLNSVTARSVAKAMWINNTVTCLDLSSNDLNDHAGTYLARVLKRNSTLRKLELDNNPLGPRTCQAFGEALRDNTSLVYLSLDSSRLCTDPNSTNGKPDTIGIKALADALRVNKTLTSLNLWRTGITAQAGSELASAIEENDSILFCDVNHNNIDMSDIKRIADKLDANLAAHEARERRQRNEAMSEGERAQRRQAELEAKRKEEEVSKWLEDKRKERAQARRQAEEDKIAILQAEIEEKKRLAEAEREVARKAAEEAAAKKSKKKEGGKK